MEHYKLKISLKYFKKYLNRTILFSVCDDLDKLAFTCLSIFNTMAYHLYEFKDAKMTYMGQISVDDIFPDKIHVTKNVLISNLKLNNNKFTFIYDTGEYYAFEIEILDKVDIDGYIQLPVVIDGKGYGIIEDDRRRLERILSGVKEEEEDSLYCDDEKFIEDFNYFNLLECNKNLIENFNTIQDAYLNPIY